jgi:stearoyl-CoA desaturase (delta-9 desaturase)
MAAMDRMREILEEAHRPHLPTLDELKRRARELAPRTPSLDDVALRAREIALEAVCARLLAYPATA